MTDESLDKFTYENKTTSSSLYSSTTSGEIVRPKLRKIKRPKIRIAPDTPPAPKKFTPEGIDNTEDILVEAPQEKADDVIKETNTNLITALEANDLVSNNEFENSYVLEGLPPELDYVTDNNLDDDGYYDGYVKKNLVIIASFVCIILGIFIGKTLFSSKKIEKHGLEGVVINQDVPSGRPRCGLTDKSQACVFYLMNWYKQELNGRDFYRLAAQLTGREEYMIETDNLRYANVKIKPGHFAQLNIPALK